jgi:cell division control protein 6
MDIAAYLAKQKAFYEKESRWIKDFSVFDFHYVPEQPVIRAECRGLIDELVRFDLSGIPNHQAVIGSRGSGKTLMIRHLQRVVPQQNNIEFLYANCRNYNTSFKLLAHLLGVQARGTSMAELFERFCLTYTKKTVIALDEVDVMSPKDRRREILYLLSRSERPYMVVMLSNSPQVLKELDAATRSSLQPVPVHFRNYDAQQIRQILEDRAKRGLHRWDERILSEIAALTTRLTNSDARLAIKTLQYVVTGHADDTRTCFERARQDLVVDMISNLSDLALMILWAAATSRNDFARSIYDRYRHFACEHHETPVSYVYFNSNLSYLQSIGLIALVCTKQGRTYANRVLLTFDPKVADEICTLRFEQ